MKVIVSKGCEIFVDDEDYESIKHLTWHANHYGKNLLYATSSQNGKTVYMHRMIMKAGRGTVVDHIDNNGLNNCKANLRICSHQENIARSRKPKNNTSGYKGVWWNIDKKIWTAEIKVMRKKIHLTHTRCLLLAAIAYDDAAKKHFKNFACTNF